MDGKQDLYNLRWHRPNSRYPYLFSDTIWDIYIPLYDFDIALVLWKGIIEFPWHVGPLPWGGRKIFGVIPFPYVPYPWLGLAPGFAGIAGNLFIQHALATDPRTWYAMVMHSKSVSNESMAIEGGMGIGTKYYNPYDGFSTWHDSGVRVRGSIVGDVNDHFVQMFNEARVNNGGVPRSRGVKIPKLRYEDYRYEGEADASGYRAWVVTTHPERGDANYRAVFVAALVAAQKEHSR